MTGPNVTVGKAQYGKGVFATRRIRAGQLIGRVTGKVFRDADYGSEYCIELGPGASMEPAAPWRFLNHACDPNSKLYLVMDQDDTAPDERAIVLEALRNIQPGVQLTIDYEWNAESAIPCGCGSANCRGWIVAEAERHLVQES